MFCFKKTYSIRNIQESLQKYEKENSLKLQFVENNNFLTILMENGSECMRFKVVPGNSEKTFFKLLTYYNDDFLKKEEHKSKMGLNGSPSTDYSLNEKKYIKKKKIKKIKKKISFLKTRIHKNDKERRLKKLDEKKNEIELRNDSPDFLETRHTNKNNEEMPVYFFYMNFY